MEDTQSKALMLRRLAHTAAVLSLACGAGVLHYHHVRSMLENDRNFSQITPLEREMSLRTEMGFYYSFYKTACGAGVLHYHHVRSMLENDRNFSQITPLEREMSLRTEMGFYYSFYKTACGAGVLHYHHVRSMLENDRNFSQITPLEREMSLRTEMGFYYSFYKTVVEEKQLLSGVVRLAYDRLVEYPDEVNAISRFNIYPEILLGGLYHYGAEWLRRWRSPLADPIFFYLEGVWWCAGATLSALFLSAVALCGNAAGGIAAAAQYLANHAECTRVQWSPNQRENFAQPFLLAQAALVTHQVRQPLATSHMAVQVAILLMNCACLMCWQFSQFVFLVQVAIFFVMEQLRVISPRRLGFFLHAHLCGLHMAAMMMQWNQLLITSLYTSFFLVVSVYALALSSLRIKVIETRMDLLMEAWLVCIRVAIVVNASLCLKNAISDALDAEDDSHIFEIFYSKFTNYKTFHTMIYTCIEVFNFLPMSYFWSVTKTGLLPLVGLGLSNVVYYWLFVSRKEEKTEKDIKKVDAAVNPKRSKEKLKARADEGSGEDSGIEHSVGEAKARKKSSRRHQKSSKSQKEESDEGKSKKVDATRKSNRECDDKIETLQPSESLPNDDPRDVSVDDKVENNETDLSHLKTDTSSPKIEEKPSAKSLENSETKTKPTTEQRRKRNCHKWVLFLHRLDIDAGIFYNVSQMVVFGCMAIIIMRLKLLFTPQLCIVASLAFSPKYYNKSMKRHKEVFLCVAVALASVAAYNGYCNLVQERSHVGHYSNQPLEELLTWIAGATSAGAVFAGPMPLTAAVMLSTRRAIVDHVHYESREARERVYAVYKTYGRFSPSDLYAEMTRLRVTHLLVQAQYCYGRSGMGCTYGQIWDAEVPSLRGGPLLCHRLLTEEVPHFYKVFDNGAYAVFRVHDYSVLYTPRLHTT